MHKIIVPTLNTNDDSCVLLEWRFENGQRVAAQEVVAVLETSKAAFDLISEACGILQRLAQPEATCKFGEVIGQLFASEDERQTFIAGWEPQPTCDRSALTLTKGARALIEHYRITEAQLRALGKTVIKESDIKALIGKRPAASDGTLTLSRRQAAVAQVVSLSHQTIPKAFLVMKVYCDTAMARLRDLMTREKMIIGLPELLVKITASLCSCFPFFFGEMVDEGRFLPATEANVGVTIDVGKGLFIPVVTGARSKSLKEIANILMDFRIKALRDTFKEEGLSGGHITLSLSTEKDIILTVPVILPSQTCMLALGSVQEEAMVTADHGLATRHYVNLGLAYDHRFINGYNATQFLKAIKSQVESPEEMVWA